MCVRYKLRCLMGFMHKPYFPCISGIFRCKVTAFVNEKVSYIQQNVLTFKDITNYMYKGNKLFFRTSMCAHIASYLE